MVEKTIDKSEKRFEGYYDGIPEDYYKKSPEQLKRELEEEERKTKEMKEW